MKLQTFRKETQRRKMHWVLMGFSAIGYAFFQLLRLIYQLSGVYSVNLRNFTFGLIVGLIVSALIGAWHYERTPEGFRRIYPPGEGPDPERTGKKLKRMTVGGIVLGTMLWLACLLTQ